MIFGNKIYFYMYTITFSEDFMKPKNGRPLKIISGSANQLLAQKIVEKLDIPLAKATVSTFSDGESQIEIHDNMRGCDVFVIQPTCYPANHNIMELYLILDALKRSACWRVTAVLPYYGFGRQDRKSKPRVPISAKAVASLITLGGIDRVLTIDLHSGQIQGFFDCPVDHLYGASVFLPHIKENLKQFTVLLSPDAGGTDRVHYYAKKLDIPMATSYKKRTKPNQIDEMIILGDVKGRHVIIIDDMIDTAGTLCKIAILAKTNGAESITCYATHAVLSGKAIENIEGSPISRVYVTDTIPMPDAVNPEKFEMITRKIRYISVSDLFAEAIKNIHNETSVSSLFE